ncbi:MAG: IS110 family transposase [Planctomycetes bacterium]|nr:IS110 family transposase [Planctomycetota bacterium]
MIFKKRRIKNTRHGRDWLSFYLKDLARQNGGSRIAAAYEPSTLGFGIYDGLVEAGIECHVLAPTKIPKATKDRKKKTDERDARWILEMLLAHVLAGNELPDIRIPDHQTRDDRETVRARLDVGKKLTSLKNQVQTLLKLNKEDLTNITQRSLRGRRRTLAGIYDLRAALRAPSACG